MCCDQPVSRSGYRHQANHWRRWYQFPHQVLIVLAIICSSSAYAEDEYYTWIDAEGRIHNSVVPKDTSADKSSAKKDMPAPVVGGDIPKLPGDDTQYLSEDELKIQQKQDLEDKPPFYIWIDEAGIVHTEMRPEGLEDEEEAAQSVTESHDHIFAPPFRLDEKVQDGACCNMYEQAFIDALTPFKSRMYPDPDLLMPFALKQGDRPAWYVRIGKAGKKTSGQRFVVLRVRGEPVEASIIALNSDLKPLYFDNKLGLHEYPENWHSVAYQETRILLEDADVAAMIIYLEGATTKTMSLEVKWADGTSPD
ncbi:hypothetical protein TOL_1626 [Thalassolituus oleivorans MIL-1]|uniref:DUF4124 domain-containing protein n=2 Tax=Thalassolituus oleivorans TaxID=187493 RepID=M5DQ76_9GAMM|nr:hypothetical protein TOL_1626 [Thalassolituus oleivorans MIL-1]